MIVDSRELSLALLRYLPDSNLMLTGPGVAAAEETMVVKL